MKTNSSAKLIQFIDIPKVYDEGILVFSEALRHIPFEIKRFYLIHNVIEHAVRGKHAHKKTRQVLFCVQGSITIILDDGRSREAVKLNKSHRGILLDTMIWHEMVSFQKNTVLLVVASEYFEESDYVRSYKDFIQLKGQTSVENNEK
ncbi:FdtA/QdtA family cupin domain-containing protein [Patescibacteria group bacterium]|nr:FdtA/QdtA family cupin domain-containing protein [Patescibacteria group bacterium]